MSTENNFETSIFYDEADIEKCRSRSRKLAALLRKCIAENRSGKREYIELEAQLERCRAMYKRDA